MQFKGENKKHHSSEHLPMRADDSEENLAIVGDDIQNQ